MAYAITDLSRVRVQYLCRADNNLYWVSLRSVYLDVFVGGNAYVLAGPELTQYFGRPAQLAICAASGEDLFRRHIPCSVFGGTIPETITVDGLEFNVLSQRRERRTSARSPGHSPYT
jgi:hypothetical protein